MKIQIWGSRGSIPSPLRPEAIRDKIRAAILQLPEIDTKDPVAVDRYLDDFPPTHTAGGNTTCVEIQTGQSTFIIDAGSGLRELSNELMKGPCSHGKGIIHFFFTHTHWDHIQGFPFFTPAFIPGNQIYIHSIHDVRQALNEQQHPRAFPIGLDDMEANLQFIRHQPGQAFYVDQTEINTLKTMHPGDAYAYRFRDSNRTFIFASDAEYKQLDELSLRPYIEFYQDADALIFDAQYTLLEGWRKTDWGHSSALIGADIARRARVKKLVLFHHDPSYSDEQLLDIQNRTIEYLAKDTGQPACEVLVAYEGLIIDLTPPSKVELQHLKEMQSVVLTPIGVFDEAGVSHMETELASLTSNGWPARLVINLAKTTSMTVAGLKALLSIRRDHPYAQVVLANLPDPVRHIIELAGLLDYFAVYPTIEAALTALEATDRLKISGQLLNNRYQIEGHFSDHWYGTLFRATDTRLNQMVVVTVISASLGLGAIEQLIQRAHRRTTLNHPNIARILDAGFDGQISFIVEEYTESETLKDLLDSGVTISPEQARQICLAVLSALEYAHSQGVIHYHLTPSHILISDTPKLRGFSLGLLSESPITIDSALTFSEPHYVAPEQLTGNTPDARTDLYGLGVLMYELFAGRPPFQGDQQTILHSHLELEPPAIQEIKPTFSRPLERLILKLLAKLPDERYVTAHQTRQIFAGLTVAEPDDDIFKQLNMEPQPLVNREVELDRIRQIWHTVYESGVPQLIHVEGELGIGKTRLVAEFLKEVLEHDNATALVGRCDEFGLPYTPYAEILTTIFNRGLVDPQSIADEISYLVRQIPSLSAVLSPFQTSGIPVSVNAQQAQWNFFETVLHILTKLGPTALFLEDTAYLDEASIALTRFLLRRTRLSLLVINAAQPGEKGLDWLNAFEGVNKTYLSLSPLSLSAAHTYLETMIGGTISDEVLQIIHSRSRGNPYFVKEITRYLIDQGTLNQQTDKTWGFQPGSLTGELPPTLIKIFSDQVERLAEDRQTEALSERAQASLSVAALIGTEFDFDTWITLLGDETEALDALDEAMTLRLVRQTSDQVYTFDPVDIADVLTSKIPEETHQALHTQLAQILTEKEANPIIISYHYQEAGSLNEAARHLEIAADQAAGAYAINEAITYYNQALEMAESLHGYESLGELYRQKGAVTEARLTFQRAIAMAQRENNLPAQAHSMNGLAFVQWQHDQYDEAYQTALEILNLDSVSPAESAKAQSLLGMIAWVKGQLADAEAWCQQAMDTLGDTPDQAQLGSINNRLGLAYLYRGKFREAAEAFNQSLAIRRHIHDEWGRAYCLNNLAKVATAEGNFEQAEALLSAAQKTFTEIDSIDGLVAVFTNQARVLLLQNHPARALPLLFNALDEAQKLPHLSAFYLGDVYLLIAQASLQRNHLTRARPAVSTALQLVEAAGNMEYVAIGQLILAQIYATEDNQASADHHYEKALAMFEQAGSPVGLIRTQFSYAQFLHNFGQPEKAVILENNARSQAELIGLYLGSSLLA